GRERRSGLQVERHPGRSFHAGPRIQAARKRGATIQVGFLCRGQRLVVHAEKASARSRLRALRCRGAARLEAIPFGLLIRGKTCWRRLAPERSPKHLRADLDAGLRIEWRRAVASRG